MRPIDADMADVVIIYDKGNELIQVSAVREYIERQKAFLDKFPTIDAVPVVRCRECKYRFKNNGHDKSGCPIIDANIWMDDDDFCSHGERKDGAD